jgi:predicted enzyme related to lactoylglutathione lyase
MTTEAKRQHHGIDYVEFTVTNMADAQRFYARAFDWTFTDYGPDYAGIRKADGEAPFEFPGGRRFHFTDPSGNELAVWSLR